MALLEQVYHCRGEPWGIIYAQVIPSDIVHFLLPTGQDVDQLLLQHDFCLYATMIHKDNYGIINL